MKKKKRKALALTALILSLSLTSACRGSASSEKASVDRPDLEYADMVSQNWTLSSSEPAELSGWDVVECSSDFSDFSDCEHIVAERQFAFDGEICYVLMALMDRAKGWYSPYDYVVGSVDLVTGVKRKLSLIPSNLDSGRISDKALKASFAEFISDGETRIKSPDVNEDGLVLFFMKSEGEHEKTKIMAATVSMEGEILGIVDYGDDIPTDYQQGYEEYWEYPEAISLENGGVCLCYTGSGKLLGFDKEGKKLFALGEDAPLYGLSCLGREFSGKLIFSCKGEDKNKEFFYIDGSEKHILFSGNVDADILASDMFGNVLSYSGCKLFSWNVFKGSVDCLFKFDELFRNCPVGQFECLGLARTKSGDVLACFENRLMGQILCYRLNDWEHPEKTEIVVLTDGYYQKVEWAACDYERTHCNVKIRIEDMQNGQYGRADDYAWMKVVQDVKDGNGPDLVITLSVRLRGLAGSEIIAPLDDILPSDIKNNTFEGVLQYGSYEGEQIMLPLHPSLQMLMVNREYYDGDTWTLTELLDAYDRAKEEKDGSIRFLGLSYEPSYVQLLSILCLMDLDHSSFFDPQTMSCDFENEEFCRLLHFCAENGVDYSEGDPIHYDAAEVKVAARRGEVFLWLSAGGLATFSSDMRDLSDVFRCVGFPSRDGIGSIVTGIDGIALSNYSKNKEIAADFMFELYGDEFQGLYFTDYWARKDYLKEHVKNADELYIYTANGTEHPDGPAVLLKASNTPIAGKKDGTSYLEEFIGEMDKGSPQSFESDIQDIILEETAGFFSGEKTAEEVAHIIQSRVKIYLDERN